MSSFPPSGSPSRVLVVEDYPDMSEALAVLLRSAGYHVAVTPDAENALATAQQFHPDIVISDIGLPGAIDGYQLARRFRSDPELRHCYLVALTAYVYPTDIEKAREAGFDEHVAKPATTEVVLALIERARAHVDRRAGRSQPRPDHPADPRITPRPCTFGAES